MPAAATFLKLKRNPASSRVIAGLDPPESDPAASKNDENTPFFVDGEGSIAPLENVEELPIMHGLRRPPPLPARRPTSAEREPWIALFERLMARGILRPFHMHQLTGVRPDTCAAWMAEIRERWGLAQTAMDQMRRVAELYGETTEIGRIALESALATKDGKSRSALLNVALKAGERRAALAGLDAKKTVEHHHTGTVEKRTTARVELDLGLTPGALAEIGQAAARQLTVAARSKMLEAEVLEAEFVESPAPVAAPAPVQAPAGGDKLSPVAPAVSPVSAPRPRPKGARSAGGSSPTTSR